MIENNVDSIDTSQGQHQNQDYPEIENFLKSGFSNEKKDEINKILENNDLKEHFSAFLKNASVKDKAICKKELINCTNIDDIKSIIIEHSNLYFKIGGNQIGLNDITKIKTINTNEVNSNNDEVNSNNDEVNSNNDEVINNNDKVINNNNNNLEYDEKQKIIESLSQAIQGRQELIQAYPELEQATNQGSVTYQKTKANLENNGIINHLKQLGLDDTHINNYIVVQATFDEIQSNTQYEALRKGDEFSFFYKAIKNLNNACNIPDTELNSFSNKNIGNTRKELFNNDIGNQNLIKLKSNNKEAHNETYENLFDIKNEELIETYGKFLGDKYENIDVNGLSENEITELENIKAEVDERSKNLIEEMLIMSQIKGMYLCLGGGGNFELNKANEIKNENGILTLNGHINGINFSLRHNTKKENSPLQTYSMISKVDKKYNLKGGFKDSPFIIPSENEVFNAITNIDFKKIAKESGNIDDYLKSIEDNINEEVNHMYNNNNTKYVHHYINKQIVGEEIANKTINILNKATGDSKIIDSGIDDTNERLYKFMEIISYNIDMTTNNEKDSLNHSLLKILEIINSCNSNAEYNMIEKSEITKDYLNTESINSTKDIINGYGSNSNKSILDFFNLFINNQDPRNFGNKKIFNFYELHNILFNPRNENGYLCALGQYSSEFNEQKFSDEIDKAFSD